MKREPAHAAAARRSASSLLETLLRDGDDLLLVTDARLRLIFVSPSLQRAAGCPAATLLRRSVVEAGVLGASAAALQAALRRALDAPATLRLALDWPRRDGERHYDIRLSVDRSVPCRPRVLVQARDLTEQRRIERDLRQREHDFRTLAENSPDNIIRYGLDLRAVYCNQEIGNRVAVTAARVIGRTPSEAAPPGMAGVETYEQQLARTLATGERGMVELRVPHPSGQTRIHSIVIAAERDAAGTVCGAVAVGRDVTEQVRMQEALAAKEREFRTLAENSPDTIIRYGPDARVTYCNHAIGNDTRQRPPRDMLGRLAGENALPGTLGVQAYREQVLRTLAGGESGTIELYLPQPDGHAEVHSVAIVAERDDDGAILGALAVGRNVSEQVRAQQALAEKEREFRSLAENAGDNIVRWDTDGRVRYCNPAMARLFGYLADSANGLTPTEAVAGTGIDLAPVEQAAQRVASDGCEQMVELRLRPPGSLAEAVHQIRLVPERDADGSVTSVLGIGRDITEKIAQMELIESLARTDTLTRLANRQTLHERAPGLFAAAGRRGLHVGVMLLDLDQFKAINDGLGHSAGDELLCEAAHRLRACLRVNDLLVRLGGDEFVVIAPDVDDAQDLGTIAAKLQAALELPMSLQHREVRITASIGVSIYPQDGERLEQLLAHADTAMYHAKRNGRARTEYFRAELGDAVRRRLMLEQAMRSACDGTGLELHFQPQVHLDAGQPVVGAEALLRWRHPTLGLLAPDAFIGLAEETGMILPIGRWVVRSAAEAAVRWNRGRGTPLHVAVNVSTRQIIEDDLPALVDEVLAQTGCSAGWLWIEITESALLHDCERVQQTLDALRSRGLRIAIDDFGTGYSALNYLARFPVDCLKIDKSFVHAIGRSRRDDELVKAFVAMAGALNLSLVAEGVETAAQADFLRGQGCGLAQGWSFGRPVPEAAFVRGLQGAAAAP